MLAVALGWAYSVPPLRLKVRAGLDVTVNALALGAFGPLAGWAAASPHGSDRDQLTIGSLDDLARGRPVSGSLDDLAWSRLGVAAMDGFPWAMALQGSLVAAALYLPTTLADLSSDRAVGYRTIAVRLGPAVTYWLGFAAWVASAGLSVVLAAADHVIPRRMLALEVVMVPVLIAAYHRLIGPERPFRGIVVLAALFLCPCAAFALTYAGVL